MSSQSSMPPMIVIVDYGMGNIGSIANMLRRVGVNVTITSDASMIAQADKLILPGVGSFDAGMKSLSDLHLIDVLNSKVLADAVPTLGLCLGMQIFTRRSEEGSLAGLGWIAADTIRFQFGEAQTGLKVPHMGWNSIRSKQAHPVFQNLGEGSRFYFVHSFHVRCDMAENVLATTTYGYEFPSAIVKGNIIGTQFHPEKSHRYGMELLRNFAGLPFR